MAEGSEKGNEQVNFNITKMLGDTRYYQFGELMLPSVTSITKTAMPTPALTRWREKRIMEIAADNRKDMALWTKAKSLDFLRDEIEPKNREAAAERGSNVHRWIEQYIKGEDFSVITEEEGLYVQSFRQFVYEQRPEFIESEVCVYSERFGYAGRADSFLRVNGEIGILDFKTGKRLYPEVALQDSAYANADFIGRDDGRRDPVPKATGGYALRLSEEGYEFRRLTMNEDTFETFLSLLDVFHWLSVNSQNALGDEI